MICASNDKAHDDNAKLDNGWFLVCYNIIQLTVNGYFNGSMLLYCALFFIGLWSSSIC
uniref:Uncharacterized protein n=1 Tax=Ciona intestinalis TaxID=7719 RepID=H2XWP9_CIOIN